VQKFVERKLKALIDWIGLRLCKIGLHKFEEEPSIVGTVELTGIDWLFFTWGIQDGKRHCMRTNCHAGQIVHREGFVGYGCPNPKWRRA
jgi:hypothetical protein